MICHHPDDALLLQLAAGSLARGPAAVAAAHAERCAHCRERLRALDAVGGALLEDLQPAVLPPDAMARTLSRIDAGPATGASSASAASDGALPSRAAGGTVRAPLDVPAGMAWPRSLRGARTTGWRWAGPGMRWSRVTLADDPAANVFLLRIAAGKSLPVHTHDGCELTQVLHGAFHDGRQHFGAGDFDEADGTVHHQPVVDAGSECICLASVEGRVAFDGRIAQVFGALVGM